MSLTPKGSLVAGTLAAIYLVELANIVIVILEAAQRPLTIYEIARLCEPYIEGFVSYFDVKQVCMALFARELVSLDCTDPLMFVWRKTPDSQNVA